MKRPMASDWKRRTDGGYYSKELNLWFVDGIVYDERSARHNGITGFGQTLRETLRDRKGEKR